MNEMQLGALLSDNKTITSKIKTLVNGWLDCGDSQTIALESIHLEFFINNKNQKKKRKKFDGNIFEIPDISIRMIEYFENAFPLRGNREETLDRLCKDTSAELAKDLVKELAFPETQEIELQIVLAGRNQFGSADDYFNEIKMNLHF